VDFRVERRGEEAAAAFRPAERLVFLAGADLLLGMIAVCEGGAFNGLTDCEAGSFDGTVGCKSEVLEVWFDVDVEVFEWTGVGKGTGALEGLAGTYRSSGSLSSSESGIVRLFQERLRAFRGGVPAGDSCKEDCGPACANCGGPRKTYNRCDEALRAEEGVDKTEGSTVLYAALLAVSSLRPSERSSEPLRATRGGAPDPYISRVSR
jgi:hypothetical protein